MAMETVCTENVFCYVLSAFSPISQQSTLSLHCYSPAPRKMVSWSREEVTKWLESVKMSHLSLV